MNPRIQSLDDAFRIIQLLVIRHDSMTAISILTRVELYLASAAQAEIKSIMEAK